MQTVQTTPLQGTRTMIGEVRFSYAQLLTPKTDSKGLLKYSTVLLIPKTNTEAVQNVLTTVQTVLAAAKQTWGFMPPEISSNPYYPLKDGDTYITRSGNPLGEECRGHWVLNADTNHSDLYPISIIDRYERPLTSTEDVYSGMWGYICLNFGDYDFQGAKGVKAYIDRNIMKTRDDVRLGGGVSASTAFASVISALPPQQFATPQTHQHPVQPSPVQPPQFAVPTPQPTPQTVQQQIDTSSFGTPPPPPQQFAHAVTNPFGG